MSVRICLFVKLAKRGGASYVTQTVLAALDKQFAEFLLHFGGTRGGERHPADILAPGFVFDGNAGHERTISPPEAANWMLAIVQNLVVSVSA